MNDEIPISNARMAAGTRRKFRHSEFGFHSSLVIPPFVILLLSGCGGEEKPDALRNEDRIASSSAVSPQRFNESPMLRKQVLGGELPPVDERLPGNPFVRQVAIEIGDYGGTLRRVSGVGYRDYGPFYTQCEMPGLLQIPMDLEEYVRNGGPVVGYECKYAAWYKWSDEGKTLTVRIREGARWSDGHPLTTEDILWPFEMMHTHEGYAGEYIAPPAGRFGEYFVVRKIDDYAFSMHAPGGSWAGQVLEALEGYPLPAHHLKKFHPDTAPGKTWNDLRIAMSWNADPLPPSLAPWIPKVVDETKGVLWERNPYYAVVDPEGNQLPYIDYVKVRVIADKESRYLAALQGYVDIGAADFGDLNKHAILKARSEAGNYDVLIWKGSRQPSQIYWRWPFAQDDNFKAVQTHKEFRQALSVGIDRAEINEKLFLGLAEPSVSGIPRDNPIYDPIQDTWLGPDREKALSLFAEIGISDRDDDGILEYEDGSDVHIIVPGSANSPMNIESAEALAAEWERLGIRTTIFTGDGKTISDKVFAGEIAFQIHTGVPEGVPFHYLGHWHNPVSYARGITIPQPPEFDRCYELERAVAAAYTVEEQIAAAREFFNYISTEALSWPHFVTDRPQQVIRHKRMGNVPDERNFQKYMMTAKSDQFFIRKEWQGRH
jgi:peptide/nickel transport system substrate-binding protein